MRHHCRKPAEACRQDQARHPADARARHRFPGDDRNRDRDRGAVRRRHAGFRGGRRGTTAHGRQSRRHGDGTAAGRPSMTAHTLIEQEALRRSPEEQREYERREVAAHYEHDPEIFSLVLDSQLTYSTGIFVDPHENLEAAQRRKFAHVRGLLRLRPGDYVFDAGCGWGSILLDVAEHTGARVHGITLSAKQREVALARARARIDVEHIGDVRLEPGSVDAIIFSGSIVHMHDRPAIHRWVARALRPGGRLFISDCYFPVQQRGSRETAATEYILGRTLGYCRPLTLSEGLA